MKIETGSFICLSELLKLHVGLMDYQNPLQICKTGYFAGKRANSEASVLHLVFRKLDSNVYKAFLCLISSSYSYKSIPSSVTVEYKIDPV